MGYLCPRRRLESSLRVCSRAGGGEHRQYHHRALRATLFTPAGMRRANQQIALGNSDCGRLAPTGQGATGSALGRRKLLSMPSSLSLAPLLRRELSLSMELLGRRPSLSKLFMAALRACAQQRIQDCTCRCVLDCHASYECVTHWQRAPAGCLCLSMFVLSL